MKLLVKFVTTLALIFGWNTNQILSARILALMPTPSPSHHIWNRAITIALAARGHHITVVTPDPEKEPIANYTEIIIEGVYERIQQAEYNYEQMNSQSHVENSLVWFHWGQDACEYALGTKAINKLLALSGKDHFDLIIIDQTLQECFLSFAPLFDSPPIISITAYVSPPWYNTMVGNPQIPSFTNTYILPYTDHMTFMQRMCNFLLHNFVIFYWTSYHIPAMDDIVRRRFGDSAVVPSEIIKENISLVMVNTHFSLDYPRPIVPAMIQVGGIHVKPGKKLPKDIQKFLDDAEHGAIFFSLGTNVRSDKMSKEKVKAFLDAFSELPQRVLWKFESDSLQNIPNNVMVRKWMPQNDILAHPNVCLFLSHAGMLSSQEAIYHGVPVVGMPFLADQLVNIYKLSSHGIGEMLPYETVTKQTILNAIHEVLDNPSYKENMKKISTIFRDQPQTPLERAVYWAEYVMRHKGTKHLRARSVDMPLSEYLLLDVIAVLLIAIAFVIILFLLVMRAVYRFIVPSKKTKSKQQ